MCGFSGYLGGQWQQKNVAIEEQLRKMSHSIIHRGPDSHGHWIDRDNRIAMTHRRLAILDLSDSGSQPMISRNERYVIAYNGEIYNHLELRKLLKTYTDNSFRGHSDTETLLACIEEFGLSKTLELLNGMFAFAVFDRELKSLSLVRDRLGEKPLYYGCHNNIFFFASDIASIDAHSDFHAEIDRDSLA